MTQDIDALFFDLEEQEDAEYDGYSGKMPACNSSEYLRAYVTGCLRKTRELIQQIDALDWQKTSQ